MISLSVYRSSETYKLRAARGLGITATNVETPLGRFTFGKTPYHARMARRAQLIFDAPLGERSEQADNKLDNKTPGGSRCARQARQRLATQTLVARKYLNRMQPTSFKLIAKC